MTVQELVLRFPEIPQDLHEEPLLAQYAEAFGDLFQVAHNPSNCAGEYDAGNHYYLKLIGPLKIYMYGLSTRDKVLAQLQALLDRYNADPAGFPASLLASGSAA
ncbi:hypothetical protein NKDENANG_02020 [Candidatus Entotheonellaceae bacterium PAL068K]